MYIKYVNPNDPNSVQYVSINISLTNDPNEALIVHDIIANILCKHWNKFGQYYICTNTFEVEVPKTKKEIKYRGKWFRWIGDSYRDKNVVQYVVYTKTGVYCFNNKKKLIDYNWTATENIMLLVNGLWKKCRKPKGIE